MGRLARSPTVQTFVAFLLVFAVQVPLSLLGFGSLFVLTPRAAPIPLVLSVYAHAGPGHLLANSVALALVGFAVERETTEPRYHAFFVASGVLAGLAQVWIGGIFAAGRPGVLGASGAVFALAGYLLAGNVASTWLLDRIGISGRAVFGLFVLVAAAVTLATAAPGIALVAHFTGLLVGLLAGRMRLLRARR